MSTYDFSAGPALFSHPKNIQIGEGRILWAPATTDTSGRVHPEGWILPGGHRTQDSFRAHEAASQIHAWARGV